MTLTSTAQKSPKMQAMMRNDFMVLKKSGSDDIIESVNHIWIKMSKLPNIKVNAINLVYLCLLP